MAKNLILVSSYPKSGNTWVRVVFDALKRGPGLNLSIDQLDTGLYGFWRRLAFDQIAPANAADLGQDEIDEQFPEVFRQVAAEAPAPVVLKVHDGAFRTRSGEWLFPPERVVAAVHIVRHPFDVAVSYAHHLGVSVEAAVMRMASDEIIAAPGGKLLLPLPERTGSWSGHIGSWLDQTAYKITLARYEDLHANPRGEFGRLAAAAGFALTSDNLSSAVESSNFERLREQERLAGFQERPRTSSAFFRVGRPRTWEESLNPDLRDQIVKQHGEVMNRLGYAADGSVAPLPASGSEGPAFA
ncbi:MAG: sulfotransferase domain-containing protein [Rhizomicrobium sp.]|jgi:hypothetical protein